MWGKMLLLFALVATALAVPVEVEDRLNIGIPGLININLSDNEQDGETRSLDWFKTPFKETKVECHPEKNEVTCSFECMVMGMKLNGGFAAIFKLRDKKVIVKIILNGETRFSKEFIFKGADRICEERAVPVVGTLEVCLATKVTQNLNNDIIACPTVFFYLDKKSFDGEHWAQIIFNCPTLTASGISWTRPLSEKDGSDALKDQKYLRFKTHDAVKKGLKYSTEKAWELVNTYFIKK